MRTRLLLALVALALALAAACGESPPPAAAPPPQAPPAPAAAADTTAPAPAPGELAAPAPTDTLTSFRICMLELLQQAAGRDRAAARAGARALLLPDPAAWFGATFPAESVPDLVADYGRHQESIDDLPGVLREHLAAGLTRVQAERFDRPGDEMSTGFQSYALEKMTHPTALYSLRLLKPDEDDGWHLWSFAFADGTFRFVGPLWTLTPLVVDDDVRLRSSMRLRDARRLRKEER